jgi:hypothetical protein
MPHLCFVRADALIGDELEASAAISIEDEFGCLCFIQTDVNSSRNNSLTGKR